MSPRRLLIYGAGHLGRQLHHHVVAHGGGDVELLGFVDDTQPAGVPVCGGLVTLGDLASAAASPQHGPRTAELLFAIGYTSMTRRRAALERVLSAGYRLFTLIHPRAMIEPGARVGDGSVVLAGAVVDQQVTTGRACFVDIGVRLTAGTQVGHNNYFSSGTSTGSRVHIGDDNFFGMDCTVTTEVTMGSRLFVNAKTLVPRDVGDDVKIVELHKSRELPMPPTNH